MRLLVVLHARASSAADAHDAVRALRRAAGRLPSDDAAYLLLCGLPAAPAPHMPEDAPVLRALQSGVMAMDGRRPGRFMLIVRGRVWDDAARAFLGDAQAETPALAAARLVAGRGLDAPLAAASVSPGSLAGCADAVLLYGASLACTPDTPARMLRRMDALGADALRGRVALPVARWHAPLRRLLALGYTPSAVGAARRFASPACPEADAPALYRADALARLADVPPPSWPPVHAIAEGCLFLWRDPPNLPDVLRAYRAACVRDGGGPALLPVCQLALLFTSALAGSPALALMALLAPELPALRHAARLPCALVRTALLPFHAALAGDALLARAFARSPGLRLRVPRMLLTPEGCALCGTALILAAFARAVALAPLMSVGLLWLAAPLLVPALDLPAVQRVPLTGGEAQRLRAAALAAWRARPADAPPAVRMLDAVLGCMLGALEPDEAARLAQAQLERPVRDASAAGLASLLCAAQFFRERMADCDAALRPLPGRIEALACTLPPPAGDSRLAVFLRAACAGDGSDAALAALRASPPEALDAPFLPPTYPRSRPEDARLLPLTHPHAFLRALPDVADAAALDDAAYLCLVSAAAGQPLHGLMMRSPVCAPFAPLLALTEG